MDIKYWLKSDGYVIRSIDSWTGGESLQIGDIRLNAGAFFCIADHVAAAANEPGVGGTWQTYWKALAEVTSTDAATHFSATDTTPYLRLIDGSSNDLAIRLNAGVLEIYDNGASALLAALTMSSKALALSGALSVAGEKTDHRVAVDHCTAKYTSAGTWTVSQSTNALIVTRTAAQADHYRTQGPIHLPARTAASKGAKLRSVRVAYTVGGTIDTANDIFSVNIIKQTLPADGSGASASVIAGDDEADLDTNHNTNAKRLASGSHTLTVTIPSGEQAYAADGEAYYVRIRVKDAATANLTFVLNGIDADYSAAEY